MLNIGIDIGGTRIKTGLVRDDKLIAYSILAVSDSGSLEKVLPQIESEVKKLLGSPGNQSWRDNKINGVGIALPCIVDSKNNRILSDYVKYNDAAETDIPGWVRRTWNTGLVIENDARAALIGEVQFGAGQRSENVVLLTIGTGIGSAVLIDGKLLKGRNFLAGNLGGHMCIDYLGAVCNCGDTGCAETVGSSWALPERFKPAPGFYTGQLNEDGSIGFEQLFRAAQENIKPAIELLKDCTAAWGAVIKNMIYAYDPEIIILTGGVLGSAASIIPVLQKNINKLSWLNNKPVRLVKAKYPDLAGMMGAAWLSRV